MTVSIYGPYEIISVLNEQYIEYRIGTSSQCYNGWMGECKTLTDDISVHLIVILT